MTPFEKALNFTLAQEGGYVNDPHDPGGETNYGISKRAYPDVNIKALTRDKAAEIYKRDYWDRIKGDQLPSFAAIVTFDAAVNSGVGQASKWLQIAVGTVPDGAIGPMTIKAAFDRGDAAGHEAIVQRILLLSRLPGWQYYGLGWTRRCIRLTQLHNP